MRILLLIVLCIVSSVTALCGTSKQLGTSDIVIKKWITSSPHPNLNNPYGKVFVLDFWAIWCAPCVKGIPKLNDLADKYRRQGVEIIGLSQDRSEKKLREFLQGRKIRYHIAMDAGTANTYNVPSYPTVVVLSRTGEIVWRGHPASYFFEPAIKRAIKTKIKKD